MTSWFTESVRYKVLVVAAAGLLTAGIGYGVERSVGDDAWKAAFNAGLDALVVILVGTVIAAYLDHQATERAAELERLRRALVRSKLLEQLGPNLSLAATGWVHRPGESAPEDEDLSVQAGLKALKDETTRLRQLELDLKHVHERVVKQSTIQFITDTWTLAYQYWLEGARPIRFRHLVGIRQVLQGEMSDADDDLRGRFAAFAVALELAEAAKLKTDGVVQENLVAAAFGRTPSVGSSLAEKSVDVARDVRLLGESRPEDAVLHLTIAADMFLRAALDSSGKVPDGWEDAVVGSLNRCVGAVEHEVANVHVTLSRLAALVPALQEDGRGGAASEAPLA